MSDSSRVALVTGGAQGLGKGITQAFLNAGYQVVVADLDEEAGQEIQHEYASLGKIQFVKTDVASEADVKALLAQVASEFGRLDVLVNNAGRFVSARVPLAEASLEEWNQVLGVNLTGAFLCTKHAAPLLTASHGAVVNIASTRALMSEPGTFAYSASKGGLVSLTHALAVSLGPHVRVNCISPGWVDVTHWQKNSARRPVELSPRDHAQHPAGRVGTPEDIARVALFLADPANGFITGTNLTADGGMTRKMIYEE